MALEETGLTLVFERKPYKLMESAYIKSDFSLGYERVVYSANAIDSVGNDFTVTWLPVEGYEAMEDESERCDWDSPESVGSL